MFRTILVNTLEKENLLTRHTWGKRVNIKLCQMFKHIKRAHGPWCGQGVSVLAFYSNDPSLNPAEAYKLVLSNLYLKKN